ncbi:hypothetical protein CHU98_g4647 [Xylaria longipes]|nr:hypothetical protein CHU98_g4647 [Xylaria longipes]
MAELIRAVKRNNLANVKPLVDNRANANQQGTNVNQQGRFHGNAFQAAIVYQDLKIVEFLVDKGADGCLEDPVQNTVLHFAVRRSLAEIVEFLLRRKARPDAKNDTGTTPFDLAIEAKKEKFIRLLLPEMKPPPSLSANCWRNALRLEHAGPLMFTFKDYLYIEGTDMPSFGGKRNGHDVHGIVLDYGILMNNISPSTFRCRWWRRPPNVGERPRWSLETSPLPSPDLCRQLEPRDLFIESWFTISCLTITDDNWPSQQVLIPETYDYLERVEGFFWVTTVWPSSNFTRDKPIEELLRPFFSVTTCGDTPVVLIQSIEDLITPLIEKFGRTFEENSRQASRQLSNARLEVLRNGGRNEDLLHGLLSDATVIEYMTEKHAHIVRSLTRLIDHVAGLQSGPWKLSENACQDSREKIKSLETHRVALRELVERSQSIIQLVRSWCRYKIPSAYLIQEFNLASILEARKSTSTNRSLKRLTWVTFVFLPLLFVALEGSLEGYFAWLVGNKTQADAKQAPGRREERRGGEEQADF